MADFYEILLSGKIMANGGGSSVTVEELDVSANGTYTAPAGKAYSPVVVSVPLPSGTLPISANGTYDVTNYASVDVSVSGGGGSSNVVTGSFTKEAGVQTIDTGYTGNGYPIYCAVYVSGGYNNPNATNWYSTVFRYGLASYVVYKENAANAPSYGATTNDESVIIYANKSSSTNWKTIAYGGNSGGKMNYRQTNPSDSFANCFAFSNKSTMKIFVASATGTEGFCPNVKYDYVIVYSE